MTLETAKNVLEKEFLLSREKKIDLQIEFMGGEPLLNFNLIKNVCEWIWNDIKDVEPNMLVRTNGTCLTSESKEWFYVNRNRIALGLSLDGDATIQNINRSGSYNRIPIDFFYKNWPEQEIKATLAPDNVKGVSESIIWFHKNNIPFNITVAHGVNWSTEDVQFFELELSKLVDYYLENPNIKPAENLFYSNFEDVILFYPQEKRRMCGSDDEIIAYSADGRSSICQMFTEITFGKKDYDGIINKIPEFIETDFLCESCYAKTVCKVCPAFNYLYTKSFHVQDKRVCGMMRAIIKYNALLFVKINDKTGFKNIKSSTELMMLNCANDILSKM